MDVELGTVGGRFFDAAGLSVPERFETHQLALHYECLRQAQRIPEGWGRHAHRDRRADPARRRLRPAPLVRVRAGARDLRREDPDRAGAGLPGYARVEEEAGVAFRFYTPEVIEIVAEARRTGLEGEELALAVEGELIQHVMSATEALARCRQGRPVAHSVFMILGSSGGAEPLTPAG